MNVRAFCCRAMSLRDEQHTRLDGTALGKASKLAERISDMRRCHGRLRMIRELRLSFCMAPAQRMRYNCTLLQPLHNPPSPTAACDKSRHIVHACTVHKPGIDTCRSEGESAWSFCGGMRTSLQDSETGSQSRMQIASCRGSRL